MRRIILGIIGVGIVGLIAFGAATVVPGKKSEKPNSNECIHKPDSNSKCCQNNSKCLGE